MKQSLEMRFIYATLKKRFTVYKNKDDSYTSTIDKSLDEPLSLFI